MQYWRNDNGNYQLPSNGVRPDHSQLSEHVIGRSGSGSKDTSGSYVFTTTLGGFNANTVFTITGGAGDCVVSNVASSGQVAFNGSIVLSGGITSDHVLFNVTPPTGAEYDTAHANLTGGPKLNFTANGSPGPPNPPTEGAFLDPTGSFNINHKLLDGRIFAGDSADSSIVSGGYIVAPAPLKFRNQLPFSCWGPQYSERAI